MSKTLAEQFAEAHKQGWMWVEELMSKPGVRDEILRALEFYNKADHYPYERIAQLEQERDHERDQAHEALRDNERLTQRIQELKDALKDLARTPQNQDPQCWCPTGLQCEFPTHCQKLARIWRGEGE